MAVFGEVVGVHLVPAQAAELALLVDLEASWENLRKTPSWTPEAPSTLQELRDRQKAYESFRTKLATYNKRYTPAHVPELLLNTPVRLGLWCRKMRDLYLQLESNPQAHCPVHLVEKAYRWADRVAGRLNKPRVNRGTPPSDIPAAIRELDALCQWCDDLAGITAPGKSA
jgi:hypothetical protein